MQNRISHINQNIIVLFVILNLVCIGYFSYFDPARWVMFFVFICNLLILWHHVRLNTKFWKEHEELFGNFSEFIKNHGSAVHFPDGEQFHENAKFLSLFKRAYIAQNLLKKDYKELQ